MSVKMVNKHFSFAGEDIAAGKYRAWELIQPLWYTVSIYGSYEEYEHDLEGFSDAQRKLLALFWYDAEVCNGGHDQFFSNSTGIVWQDALAGMRMIGAVKTADNFQTTVDQFGGRVPFDRGERIDALEKLYADKSFDDFRAADLAYYGQDNEENIDQLMNEYVQRHPADFIVDGNYLYAEF